MAESESHAQAWERRERESLWRELSTRGVRVDDDPVVRIMLVSWANSYACLYARDIASGNVDPLTDALHSVSNPR